MYLNIRYKRRFHTAAIIQHSILGDPVRTARKRQDPPGQEGTKQFCQQTHSHREDSFQVARIHAGCDNPYSREEVVTVLANKGSQGNVEKSNFVMNKIMLKGDS